MLRFPLSSCRLLTVSIVVAALMGCQGEPAGDTDPDGGGEKEEVTAYGEVTVGTCETLWLVRGDHDLALLGQTVTRVGDLDADGVGDLAVSELSSPGFTDLIILSGATGERIQKVEVGAMVGLVAAPGDLDGDGVPDFVSTATTPGGGGVSPGDGFSSSGGQEESVRAFSGADGSAIWTQTGEAGARFAFSVTAVPDQSGDGVMDLAIGDATVVGGQVRTVDGLTGTTLSIIPAPAESMDFGTRVVSMGDINDDGFGDLFITDARGPMSKFGFGIGMAFSGADGTMVWSYLGEASATYPAFFGNFVLHFAVDLNGDGIGDVVAAAHVQEIEGVGSDAGRVTALDGATGAVLWDLDGSRAGEVFGHHLAPAGDIDGDGVMDILAGAPSHFGASIVLGAFGRVVVLSGKTGAVLVEIQGEAGEAQPSDALGVSGDSLGADINGDGQPDLVLSASQADGATTTNSGVVFAVSCAP